MKKNLAAAIRRAIPFLTLFFVGSVAAQTPRLTLGVFPGVGSGQLESFEVLDRFLPFAQYLSAKSGAQVLLLPVRVPRQAMRTMIEGDTGYKLFFGPPVFAAEAIHRAGYVPIVVEQERIRGVFVVREGSKLQGIKDFTPATRIAMPVPTLLLSVLANDTLAQRELVPQPGARKYMASVESIVLALDNGLADVAVFRDLIAQKLMSSQPARFRIVGDTLDAPGFALIAHKMVPKELREKLRRASLALNKDPSPLALEARSGIKMSPFVTGRPDEFVALQRIMDAAKLASNK